MFTSQIWNTKSTISNSLHMFPPIVGHKRHIYAFFKFGRLTDFDQTYKDMALQKSRLATMSLSQ
jgi:hypothetical protein